MKWESSVLPKIFETNSLRIDYQFLPESVQTRFIY